MNIDLGRSALIFDVINVMKLNLPLIHLKVLQTRLGLTIDFLINSDNKIMDKKLLQKIKEIESFTKDGKTKIYDLIDMAISYHKTKKAYS